MTQLDSAVNGQESIIQVGGSARVAGSEPLIVNFILTDDQ